MRRLLLLSAAILAGSSARADEKYVTIKGQVKWNGEKAPAAAPIDFKANPDEKECCKNVKGGLLSSEFEVDPKTFGVKAVIVWLRPDDDDREKPFPTDKIHPDLAKAKSVQRVIDQPDCQFEPRVLAARAGDTLVVKNSAKIGHNINFIGNSPAMTFNVIIPAGGEHSLKAPLEADRRLCAFKCDIHGWMKGAVRVFDHPYFATTDKDGKFEIVDAPVGKWRIVYWHEGGFHKGVKGFLGFPIEVKGDKKTLQLEAIKLELPPKLSSK